MSWELIDAGTSVLGRQSLNTRVGPQFYGALLLPLVPVSQQRFFGVLSKEWLNTPITGVYSQAGVIKVWTKCVVFLNDDVGNDVDMFMFWRVAGIDWEAYRFD